MGVRQGFTVSTGWARLTPAGQLVGSAWRDETRAATTSARLRASKRARVYTIFSQVE
jgi:hypothetical protein